MLQIAVYLVRYGTRFCFFFLMIRRPPRSTLFPYTTLRRDARAGRVGAVVQHRPDLGRAAVEVPRRALGPLPGVVEIAHLEEDEAAELLLGLHERPVGDMAPAALHAHGRGRLRALEPLAGQKDARLARRLSEFVPRRHRLLDLLGLVDALDRLVAVQRQQHLHVQTSGSWPRAPMSRIMKGTNDSRDVDSGNAPTPNAAARRSAAAPGARLQLVDALRCLGLGEVAVGLLAGRARK